MTIRPTCANCNRELKCLKNNVPVVHYTDNDVAKGIDAVRLGDMWGCPACGCKVIIGMGEQMESEDMSMYQLHQFEQIVEIKR
jgi:hypothetical protein